MALRTGLAAGVPFTECATFGSLSPKTGYVAPIKMVTCVTNARPDELACNFSALAAFVWGLWGLSA